MKGGLHPTKNPLVRRAFLQTAPNEGRDIHSIIYLPTARMTSLYFKAAWHGFLVIWLVHPAKMTPRYFQGFFIQCGSRAMYDRGIYHFLAEIVLTNGCAQLYTRLIGNLRYSRTCCGHRNVPYCSIRQERNCLNTFFICFDVNLSRGSVPTGLIKNTRFLKFVFVWYTWLK